MGTNPLFNDYETFTGKFRPRKTTDDCYTPPAVYDAVCQYVDRHVTPLAGRTVLRPFYPGGDYQSADYPDGCIVLDNPPFSILSQIVAFYEARQIAYFLFAPALTLTAARIFRSPHSRATAVACQANVTYHNGAVVRTSFLTNQWPGHPALVIAGTLHKAIADAQATPDHSRRQLRYPPTVITPALCGKIATRGIDLTFPREETRWLSRLNCGQSLFGGGFLISRRLAAQRQAAERLAAQRQAERETHTYTLDPDELAIIDALSTPSPHPADTPAAEPRRGDIL